MFCVSLFLLFGRFGRKLFGVDYFRVVESVGECWGLSGCVIGVVVLIKKILILNDYIRELF